jgi:hypothetical protein
VLRITTLLLIILAIVSFLCGLGGYLAALHIVWQQSISTGDLNAVLLFGGMAYLIVVCPLYFLIIKLIDKHFTIYKGILYPIGCMAIFFIPTIFILGFWGGNLKSIFSPEAQLFYAFFITSGLIFGFGCWIIKPKNNKLLPNQLTIRLKLRR